MERALVGCVSASRVAGPARGDDGGGVNRALRRHHLERMKRKVADYYLGYAKGNPRLIGRLAHTRTICSCPMCGNPRRHFKIKTRQELLAEAA
jgi:hypothetical protein